MTRIYALSYRMMQRKKFVELFRQHAQALTSLECVFAVDYRCAIYTILTIRCIY